MLSHGGVARVWAVYSASGEKVIATSWAVFVAIGHGLSPLMLTIVDINKEKRSVRAVRLRWQKSTCGDGSQH